MSQQLQWQLPEEELLHKYEDSLTESSDSTYMPANRLRNGYHMGHVVCSALNFCLFFVYLFWTFALWNKPNSAQTICPGAGPNMIHSPAREAVSYEAVIMNNSIFDENAFKGNPRPEQTQAWNGLHSLQNIAISKEDLALINRTSIQLPDGSGYLAQLDVFHELHCLNIIREFVHRDYYQSDEATERRVLHVDHCIDTLRQILMCHGDISLVTFDWVEHERNPFPNFLIQRECRNWDRLVEWTKNHQADVSKLRNPLYQHHAR